MARRIKESSGKLLLVLIAVLLGANLIVQLNAGSARTAQAAGLPDSGAQLQGILDEQRATNKHLDVIEGILNSGNLTVKTKSLDKDTK